MKYKYSLTLLLSFNAIASNTYCMDQKDPYHWEVVLQAAEKHGESPTQKGNIQPLEAVFYQVMQKYNDEKYTNQPHTKNKDGQKNEMYNWESVVLQAIKNDKPHAQKENIQPLEAIFYQLTQENNDE